MNILIVGLGNIGDEYAQNRHNIGWHVLDFFHKEHEFSNWRDAYQNCRISSGIFNNQNVTLLKPLTMMNLSGNAVKNSVQSITPDKVIVIHDEMDIPYGDVRMKFGGSRADHRGLRDVVRVLDTHDFHRIRCGIGRPPKDIKVLDHVLSDFTQIELETMNCFINNIVCCLSETLNSL